MKRFFRERRTAYGIIMEVASNETIEQAVITGMGLSFLSAHTAGFEPGTGGAVALDAVGLPVMRDRCVMHPAGRCLSPIAAAFRAFLLNQVEKISRRAVEAGSRA